jgi:hypothetical protein
MGAAESGLVLAVADAPAGLGVGAVEAESIVEVFFSPPHAARSTALRAIAKRVTFIGESLQVPGFAGGELVSAAGCERIHKDRPLQRAYHRRQFTSIAYLPHSTRPALNNPLLER